jgi:hypothetical protein
MQYEQNFFQICNTKKEEKQKKSNMHYEQNIFKPTVQAKLFFSNLQYKKGRKVTNLQYFFQTCSNFFEPAVRAKLAPFYAFFTLGSLAGHAHADRWN